MRLLMPLLLLRGRLQPHGAGRGGRGNTAKRSCAAPLILLQAASGPSMVRLLAALLLLTVAAGCWLPLSAAQPRPTGCDATFGEVLRVTEQNSETSSLVCPAGCLGLTGGPQLYGSFPYHSRSGVCIAAIHAGVISNDTGGTVMSSMFFRQTWNNDSTQTVFPFLSAFGSFSNGVQSEDVPQAWIPLPADRFAWSATVRAAVGLYVAQRRSAPFSPRAEHVHSSVHLSAMKDRYFDSNGNHAPMFFADVIMGGRNATHLLNDVWIAARQADSGSQSDWTWQRLPDAPWSPRSNIAVWWDESAYNYSVDGVFRLYAIGGQTGDRCGLPELGVCSNEVWTAELREVANATMTVNLTWLHRDPSTVPLLPFAPRCGAALVGWTAVRSDMQDRPQVPAVQLKGLIGGQLAYSDGSCSSPPAVTNEAWYTIDAPDQSDRWYRASDAPFSPRRSQQQDDSFVHIGNTGLLRNGLSAFTLVGGIRYTALRFDATANRSILSGAEMFADVYECSLPRASPLRWNVSACEWNGNGSLASPPSWPADSTPLPTVGGASVRAGGGLGGVRFGGQTSLGAISEWQQTPPVLLDGGADVDASEIATNISVILSAYFGRAAISLADVMKARRNLSLSQTLQEAELNAADSPYSLGTDFVVSHFLADTAFLPPLPQASTLHHQPWAWADGPEEATWFTPQVAPSRNTSRPLFNFRLRRFGHGMSVRSYWTAWGWQMISGGRSGDSFNSDWIRLMPSRCASPTDPQHRAALGPVVLLEAMQDPVWGGPLLDSSQMPGGTARVRCQDEHHWEPPVRETQLELFCAPNGVWMSFEALTLQRCVHRQLNCSFPQVDLGFSHCAVPLPRIDSIRVMADNGAGPEHPVLQVNNFTVHQAPIVGGVLAVIGRYFSLPTQILVGGRPCELPQLWATVNGSSVVCEQADDRQRLCDVYADEVRCTLPAVFGVNMAVVVYSGSHKEIAAASSGELPSITSTAPVVSSINASECTSRKTELLQLLDCPNDRSFDVTIYFQAHSVVGHSPVFVRLATAPPLNCSRPLVDVVEHLHRGRVDCSVSPRLASNIPLRIGQGDLSLQSLEPASLSFASCKPGYRVNYHSVFNRSTAAPCLPCEPGFSTQGGADQADCQRCLPGTFANGTGNAVCEQCAVGYFTADTNATLCRRCPVNSWSQYSGRTRCDECTKNTYIRYGNVTNTTAATSDPQLLSATCEACPPLAACDIGGNITAMSGAFLLLDQSAGAVRSIPCRYSACQSALPTDAFWRAECSQSPAQLLVSSELAVTNCCAEGRYPAFDSGNSGLLLPGGVNVLCASCLPGHSSVNGRCVPCSSVHWAALVGVVLLATVLVYLLHRIPRDWDGSALVNISIYFLQQALLLGASESLPPLLSLLNVNLLGDHVTRGVSTNSLLNADQYVGVCIVPLSDVGRIVMQLLSPLLALALLAMLLLLQLAWRRLLTRQSRPPSAALPSTERLLEPEDRRLLDPASTGESCASWLYRRIFTPHASGASSTDADDELSDRSVVEPERRGDSLRSLLLRYQWTCFRLVLMAYQPVSLLTLSFLQLQPVGEFGLRVLEFPTISPDSSEYRILLPVMATLLAVFVCGLPVVLLVWLWRQHRLGRIGQIKEETRTRPGGVFYSALSHRDALVLQMCAMYKTRYWWHSVFVIVRRLPSLALLLFAPGDSVWIWLSLLNTALLVLHLIILPYQRELDNASETLTLASLVLLTTVRSVWPPPVMNGELLTAFIALVVAQLIPFVATAALLCHKRIIAARPLSDIQPRQALPSVQRLLRAFASAICGQQRSDEHEAEDDAL